MRDRKLTIHELIAEWHRRTNSAPIERLAAALLIPAALRRRLDKLDDRQLGLLLDEEVGANLNVFSPELTICDEAVRRLRRHADGSQKRKPFGIRRRPMRSFAASHDEGEHLLHAESALYRAGIPFLQLPWQRNRFASGTFLVTDIAQARACLLQEAFRGISRCATVLVHGQTGQAIRLYEDRTRLYSTSEEGLS